MKKMKKILIFLLTLPLILLILYSKKLRYAKNRSENDVEKDELLGLC